MNQKIAFASFLGAFTVASLALPALAFKTAPVISKVKTQRVISSKLTTKSNKISLKSKAAPVISCGKK